MRNMENVTKNNDIPSFRNGGERESCTQLQRLWDWLGHHIKKRNHFIQEDHKIKFSFKKESENKKLHKVGNEQKVTCKYHSKPKLHKGNITCMEILRWIGNNVCYTSIGKDTRKKEHTEGKRQN